MGTYPFTLGTLGAGNNYTLVLGGSVTFAITKAQGAAVTQPAVSGSPTSDSITVNTVSTVTVTGQTVEYAISTASDGTGLSAYQSGTTFTGLNANTTYYVYARSASNANYNEGTANVSAGIKTALPSAADVIFPTAAAITYGAALSTSTLNGGSTARGSFTWQTPSTIPTVTNSGYLMEFTPNDSYDYSAVDGWNGSKVVRTVAITVNKKSVTITPTTGQSKTYGANDPTFEYTQSEALLSGNAFSGALAYTGENVGTYPFTLGTLSAGNNYTLVLGGSVTFAITKAAGAAVGIPTVSGTPTSTSITVNTVAAPGNGQTVEYAILTVNNGSPTSWQNGTAFSGLTANTTYYVYARSASNANYNAGTASVSAGIATIALEEITSEKGIVLVKIPAGTFTMGSPDSETGSGSGETQHQVTLTKSFYMGKYQVTQEQYQAVMGSNPSSFKTAVTNENGTPGNLPVEMVRWYGAIEFCNTLSAQEGLSPYYVIDKIQTDPNNNSGNDFLKWTITVNSTANGYRLPTEAEWEYACRAGTTTAYNTGDTISNNTGWYSANSSSKTHQVGLKAANAWGLYDMHGNVWEWCWDWSDSSYYSSSPDVDPEGAVSGANRVIRGGGWSNSAALVRSATRSSTVPSDPNNIIGFRLVRSAQ